MGGKEQYGEKEKGRESLLIDVVVVLSKARKVGRGISEERRRRTRYPVPIGYNKTHEIERVRSRREGRRKLVSSLWRDQTRHDRLEEGFGDTELLSCGSQERRNKSKSCNGNLERSRKSLGKEGRQAGRKAMWMEQRQT